MGYLNDEKKRDEIRKIIAESRLMDDKFFNVVLDENVEATQEILRVIVGKPNLSVISARTQKTTSNLYGKGTRADLLATASTGSMYVLEAQRANSGASGKRAAFSLATILTKTLDAGENYGKLKGVTVIFFTENDVFGMGLPKYEFEMTEKKTNAKLKDGNKIIYVNGAYKNERTKLGKLIHDFLAKEPDDMYSEILADSVRKYKDEPKGEIMGVWEEMLEEKAKELRKEIKKELKKEIKKEFETEIAMNMFDEGMDVETVAKVLKITKKKAKELKREHDVVETN